MDDINEKKGTKAQKDVQEILLSGSNQEMKNLLNDLKDNKNLSILEKKVYECLIQYKNKKYDQAKVSIEELIFYIGGFQEQQQAKVYLLKAQIYEKLQGNDITLHQKVIQESLDKCYRIFRNRRFNKIQFDVHHYLLQIADMQIRQKQNEEAEQIYTLIFNKPQLCRYPNDWAIFIEAYLRYFDSKIRRNNTIDSELFELCLQKMQEKYLDRNYLHKLQFYQAVNSLLRSKEPSEEFFEFLKQSGESYQNKNKIKKNHKMIYFVNEFITVDDSLDSKIIQMIPIFLKLGEQFKEVVKNRLILLHKEQKSWELKRLEQEKKYIAERDEKLQKIYKVHQNNKIKKYIDQQNELKDKITKLEQDKLQLAKEWDEKQNKKPSSIDLKNYKLKIDQQDQQIQNQQKQLKQIQEEKLQFVKELQLNQEPFEPEEFQVYKIFEESKQNENEAYHSLSENEQQNFKRKYTLDQNQIKIINNLLQDMNKDKQNIIQENDNQYLNLLGNLKESDKQKQENQLVQIEEYCCYEFIQLEEFQNASNVLKQMKFSGFKTILTLLLFCNLPYESGVIILKDWITQFDKKKPQSILINQVNIENLLINLQQRIKDQSKVQKEQEEQKEQKEFNELQELIKSMTKYIYNPYLDYEIIKTEISIIDQAKLYDKLKFYARNEQGCLWYLIEDIKSQRFYDPHVYEFKNIIYDIIYQRKGKNSQAILFDGSTYADILKKNQNSWKLKQ